MAPCLAFRPAFGMLHRRLLYSTLVVWALVVWAIAIACFSVPSAATASIQTYREQPGQVTLRSQQSLRDRSDRAWQAVLFKRYQQGKLDGLYLRLVGFPGAVAVDRQRPLAVETGTALMWQCPYTLDDSVAEFPPNVGQYGMQTVLDQLQRNIPLELAVPLQTGRSAKLLAAPFVVEEWRSLNQLTPEDLFGYQGILRTNS
ncbi:MAG: DUF3122 domain-containing protein [Cyanobacteria bacterium P01_C01_bin.73]